MLYTKQVLGKLFTLLVVQGGWEAFSEGGALRSLKHLSFPVLVAFGPFLSCE